MLVVCSDSGWCALYFHVRFIVLLKETRLLTDDTLPYNSGKTNAEHHTTAPNSPVINGLGTLSGHFLNNTVSNTFVSSSC